MGRFGQGAAMITACSAALAIVSLAAAAPGGSKPLTVSGTQTVVDEQKGAYRVQGSLVGSWNMTAFTTHYAGADGRFVGSGKETFQGCLDADRSGACEDGEPSGTLRFSFVYWATYKPGTEKLVKGQCVHPIVGGSGAFAKAKGVIHMTDVPSKGGVRTTYSGTLNVPGISSASAQPTRERWPASLSAASRAKGGCGR